MTERAGVLAEGHSGPEPPRPATWVWAVVVIGGLLPLTAFAYVGLNPAFLSAVLLLGIAGLVLLANTQAALIFVAFAIIPLGIVQVEVASVTIGLSEAIILALVIKEAWFLFAQDQAPSPMVPWRWVLLYLVASLAGVVTGILDGNGITHVLQDWRQFVEFIVLYLLVIHRVAERNQIRRMLMAFMLGGSLVALHGIVQRYTGIGIPGDQLLSDAIYHGDVRSGSFYGSTPLGAMMVLGLGPTIGLFLATRNPALRGLLLLVAAILLTSAVFTQTRASWLAIALLLVLIFLAIRKGPGLIALAVCGALVFSVLLGPMVVSRMSKLTISKSERSLLERVRYYTAAYHIFRHAPVLGLGWGCEYDINLILANERYVPSPKVSRGPDVPAEPSTVHSAYLQLLVKSGVLGLVTFLLLLISWGLLMLRAHRRRPREEADHALFVSVAAAVIAYLFHSGLENFFQWPVMSQAFWMLLGLTTVMAHQLRERGVLGTVREEET